VKKPLKTSSKTAVKKTSTPAKVKTAAKAKPAAPVKKQGKPAPAKAGKTTVTKAAVKAKPVEKKAAPKPASKPVAKPVAKAASKPVIKPVTKPVSKAPAKPVSKAKPAAKPVAKSAPKPVAKAPVKVAAKVAVKVAAKAAPKATPKAAAKPAAPVKAEKVAKPAKAEKPAKVAKAEKSAPVAPSVAVAPVVSGDVPARAVRPSARLAQITVPSMAQSVASTAAKASYLQNMPTQALTPPPFVAVKKDAKLANNWKTKKPDQLSDAEIMAMSDKDYMNDAQMAYFRIKLVILKQGILANAGETTEHLREDTVVVPDPADRATIEEEHALELRTRDRERKLLKKIEQSIQRIDSGDYGYCDETGEPIGVGRLLARPTANLSLEAQQRRELKQKMFGD
jgi:DnaK suppressor protein